MGKALNDHIIVHVCLPQNECLTPLVVNQNQDCNDKVIR